MSRLGNEISSEWEVQRSRPSPGRKKQQKKNKFRSWNRKERLNPVCAAIPVTPQLVPGRS